MRLRALCPSLAALAIVVLAACAPPAEPPAPADAAQAVDLAAEEQAVRDSSMQWLAAEQGRDLLTAMSFMDANVTAIFDGTIQRGRAEVEAAKEAIWDENPDATIEWATKSVHVAASGDLAYEMGVWTTDPDGLDDPEAEIGEFLTVWKKVDGQWKVVADAGSTIRETGG